MRVIAPLMTIGSTVVVGLNGALQKRFVLPDNEPLTPGNVHRALRVEVGVGGKGQDVAATLSCLEYDRRANLRLAQFIGRGAEGDAVYNMLADLLGEEAMSLTVRPTGCGMRTCTSIVTTDSTTELVEPSGTVSAQDVDELMNKLQVCARGESSVDALVFMGSMPPGCSDDMYANIYEKIANRGTLCLIDSVNGLGPLLKTVAAMGRTAQSCGPVILKVNASELLRLAELKKSSTSRRSEAGGAVLDEVVQSISGFLNKFEGATRALAAIAITDGAHPAFVAIMPAEDEHEFRLFQLNTSALSSLSTTLYPIGAGDAVAAGTMAAWKCLTDSNKSGVGGAPSSCCVHPDIQQALMGNESPPTRVILSSFAFGLACGSASCLQEENSYVTIQDVLELYSRERPIFLGSHALSVSSSSR
jgi:fructose-1-phosphate kinase PfkB-like protein